MGRWVCSWCQRRGWNRSGRRVRGNCREALGAAQVSCSEPATDCTCGLGVARAGRRCGRSRFHVTSQPGRRRRSSGHGRTAQRAAEGPGSPRACKLPGTEPGGRLVAWFHDWNVHLPWRYVTDPPPPCPCWQSRGGAGGETPNQRSPRRKVASVSGRARCPCGSPVWGRRGGSRPWQGSLVRGGSPLSWNCWGQLCGVGRHPRGTGGAYPWRDPAACAGRPLPSEKPAVLALVEPSVRGASPLWGGGQFLRGDRPLSGGKFAVFGTGGALGLGREPSL